MKKSMKLLAGFFLAVLVLTLSMSSDSPVRAEGAGRRIMTVTVSNKNMSQDVGVYLDTANGYNKLSTDPSSIEMLTANTDGKVSVSVKVLDTSLIRSDSVTYDKSIALKSYFGDTCKISFSYAEKDSDGSSPYTYSYQISFRIFGNSVNPKVNNLVLEKSSKGFNPSKGNYLRIKANLGVSSESYNVRLRIYNSKGKYVYQAKYTATSGGYLDVKWNGKPTKKNQAKAKTGKYVSNGKYTVEVYAWYKSGSTTLSSKKRKKITVTGKASSGTTGLGKAKTTTMYTGNSQVDYMAEQMCKKAGVTSGMSDDQKVKLIYTWMTKNFRHVHYSDRSGSDKTYYKLTSLKKKIATYSKKTDKQVSKGNAVYTYSYSYMTATNMQHQYGVCDDHAEIFKILCNHVGVNAGVCSGYYKNLNGSLAGHSWNYAIINGVTYYYDIDVEIQNYGKGQGNYYWYKKTKSQSQQNHIYSYIR